MLCFFEQSPASFDIEPCDIKNTTISMANVSRVPPTSTATATSSNKLEKSVRFSEGSDYCEVDIELPVLSHGYKLDSMVIPTKMRDGKYTSGVFAPIAAPWKLPIGNKVGRCLTPKVILNIDNENIHGDIRDLEYEVTLRQAVKDLFQRCPILHEGERQLQAYSSDEYIPDPCPTPVPETPTTTPFEDMSDSELENYVYRYRGPWARNHWWPVNHPTRWHGSYTKTAKLELCEEMPAAYKPAPHEMPKNYNIFQNKDTGFWIVQACQEEELIWAQTRDERETPEEVLALERAAEPVPTTRWANSRLRRGGADVLREMEENEQRKLEWSHDGLYRCKPDPYQKAPHPSELPIPTWGRK